MSFWMTKEQFFWMTREQFEAHRSYVRALAEFAAHYQHRKLPPVPAEKMQRCVDAQLAVFEVFDDD